MAEPVLQVTDLHKHFGSRRKVRRSLDGVSLTIAPGEIVGVVGESGCGKTTFARTVARLYAPTSGSIQFDGHDLATLKGKALRDARHRLQMVFQNPMTALDPRRTVADSIAEPLGRAGGDERKAAVASAMKAVGLPAGLAERYPAQLSGGQRQRVCIARALVSEPTLVLADEPTASLDVSTQAQIVNLILDLQRERQMSFLFITHNLALADHLCQRVVVMYAGRVVETATSEELFSSAAHPYTKVLLETAVEAPRPAATERAPADDVAAELVTLPEWTEGCAYRFTCSLAEERCHVEAPALRSLTPTHEVACHLVDAPSASDPATPAPPAATPRTS